MKNKSQKEAHNDNEVEASGTLIFKGDITKKKGLHVSEQCFP